MKLSKKGQKTSEDIIQAAIRCVASIGIEHTSIGEIAKMADVNRSLVAYYFPKKDDLFLKITEHIIDKMIQYLEGSSKRPTHLQEALALVEDYFQFNHDQLVNYLNLLYYCNLRYRYYGHLREFYTYLQGFDSLSDEEFLIRMDSFTGKIARDCMRKTHNLPMLHSQVQKSIKAA
jgi:AcrR family transcriptional regulator